MMKSISTLALLQARTENIRRLEGDFALTGQEIGTGKKADLPGILGRDVASLIAARQALSKNAATVRSIETFERRADIMQAALGELEGSLTDLVTVTVQNSPDPGDTLPGLKVAADASLATLVSTLNSQIDGRYLFSGDETTVRSLFGMDVVNPATGLSPQDVVTGILDGSAFTPAQPAALATLDAAGAATAVARFDAMFDGTNAVLPAPQNAFSFEETVFGATVGGTPVSVRLDDGAPRDYGISADEQGFRDALQGAMMLASVDLETLEGTDAYQPYVSAALQNLTDGLDAIRERTAELGAVQADAADRKAVLAAEETILVGQINTFEQADPIEAQSRFVEIEKQLESSYSVTVRMSRLRLSNFIR